jgi:hypothetical protein
MMRTAAACLLVLSRPSCPSGTSFGAVVMAANGAGAYQVSDLATGTTALRSFSAAGLFADLAAGAVDTLRLAGSRIVWKQAGVEHTAPLP